MSIFNIDEIKKTHGPPSIIVVEQFLLIENRPPEIHELDDDGNPFTVETAEYFLFKKIPKPWRISITHGPLAAKAPNDSVPEWHTLTGNGTRYAETKEEVACTWDRLNRSAYLYAGRTVTDPEGTHFDENKSKKLFDAKLNLF